MVKSMICECGGIKKYIKYVDSYPARKCWKCDCCGRTGEHFLMDFKIVSGHFVRIRQPEMYETAGQALLGMHV